MHSCNVLKLNMQVEQSKKHTHKKQIATWHRVFLELAFEEPCYVYLLHLLALYGLNSVASLCAIFTFLLC